MNRGHFAFMLLVLTAIVLLVSCGGGATSTCYTKSVTVFPQNAIANHLSTPPGNQVQFAGKATISDGCFTIAQGYQDLLIGNPPLDWTTSDPVNTTIVTDTMNPMANGVATCVGRTTTPATITGTLSASRNAGVRLTATTTLSCE